MRRLLLYLLLPALLVGLLLARPMKTNASFVANNLIDDYTFSNSSTMPSAASIDNWLNQFPNSCISTNNGFSAPDVTGYSPNGPSDTGGYYYGSDVSAGTIIYHASQVYGLNPQVILTTLEKEESLVTGSGTQSNPGCSNLRYTAAMGYLCTDTVTPHDYSGFELYSLHGTSVNSVSGTCVEPNRFGQPSYVGFSRQIITATWQLKFDQNRSEGNIGWDVQRTNYPNTGNNWDNSDDPQACYSHKMTQGYYVTCPGGSPATFDGLYNIDGTTVHMDNGPTAALYNYTPHFPGNQNFVSIFEGWFGATISSTPIYQGATSGKLYVAYNGVKYYIPTFDIMIDWGLHHYPADILSDSYLNTLQDGNPLSMMGKMSDDPNSPLFLFDDGKRYPIPLSACANDLSGNPNPNTTWGLDCFNTAVSKSYPSAFMQKYTVQDITLPPMMAYNNSVWKLEQGKKRRIVDSLVIDVLGGWNQVRWMKDSNAQQPIGKMLMRNNYVVRFSDSPQVYLYDNNQLNPVPSPDIIVDWGLDKQPINDFPVSFNSSDPLPVGSSLTQIAQAPDSSYYLVDKGYKMPLGGDTAQWPTASPTVSAPGALGALTSIPLSNVYKSDYGTIFTVYGSKKYVFATFNDFLQLGFNSATIRRVSGSVENLPGLVYGGMHLASGRLYKINNNPNQIYMVNGSNSLYVNSTNYPGLPYSSIITVDPITAARYPVNGTYTP